jgi:hypothetical protein
MVDELVSVYQNPNPLSFFFISITGKLFISEQMENLRKSLKPEWNTPNLDDPALLSIFRLRRGIK